VPELPSHVALRRQPSSEPAAGQKDVIIIEILYSVTVQSTVASTPSIMSLMYLTELFLHADSRPLPSFFAGLLRVPAVLFPGFILRQGLVGLPSQVSVERQHQPTVRTSDVLF